MIISNIDSIIPIIFNVLFFFIYIKLNRNSISSIDINNIKYLLDNIFNFNTNIVVIIVVNNVIIGNIYFFIITPLFSVFYYIIKHRKKETLFPIWI